ncbi:MAG: hypothetical protein ABL958_08380 [Bdellovibrionia bacterium]
MKLNSALFLFLSVAISIQSAAQSTYYNTKSSDFTFEKLTSIIERGRVQDIESLLSELPQEFRNEFVAVYNSRSLQEASFENPRIIMFGTDASLIVSFNGDRSQKGFDRLEVIQFREKTARFEFRELIFDGKSAPSISAANPLKCLKCHQSPVRNDVDPRPNWEPYFSWPGVFGSNDGNVSTFTHLDELKKAAGKNREMLALIKDSDSESTGFQAFSQRKAAHSRYRTLGKHVPRNPLDFTQRLGILNFKRINRLIRAQPQGEFYLTALQAQMNCGYEWETLLEPDVFDAHEQGTRRPDRTTGFLHEKMNALSFLFEPTGVDTSDWSMSFNTDGRFAFSNRFGMPGNHDIEFSKIVFGESQKRQCGEMAATTRQSSRTIDANSVALNDPARPLLNACAKCHSGSAPTAPPIAFDNLRILKFELQEGDYPRGTLLEEIKYRLSEEADPRDRMPEGFHLPAYQNKILLDYLKTL